MNAWFLATFGPELNGAALVLTGARSLPFDLAHSIGNVLLAVAVGPSLYRLLSRYAARTRVRILPPPPVPEDPRPGAPEPVSPSG